MPIYNLGLDFEDPIVINDKHASVSHDHASISIEDGLWSLEDHNSTNGTFVEVDGTFQRCEKLIITPSTWIRLGEQGHRGYYFKARRILYPNDYREDFEEIYDTFQEFENTRSQLEQSRRVVKFITPVLMCIGLVLSLIPKIRDNGMAVRASFMLPGFLSPFIQDFLLSKLEMKLRRLQKELICPKCRRPLSKDDIINREHAFCRAH